jgi:monoamine oxidase
MAIAGLSGLCLTQALLRVGFDVQVYECDPSSHARRQGYRITRKDAVLRGMRNLSLTVGTDLEQRPV